jgi:hypothetical protein
MNDARFKRKKHGHVPGDVHKAVKISMREGQHPDKARSKAFRRAVKDNQRAVIKRRTLREMAIDT